MRSHLGQSRSAWRPRPPPSRAKAIREIPISGGLGVLMGVNFCIDGDFTWKGNLLYVLGMGVLGLVAGVIFHKANVARQKRRDAAIKHAVEESRTPRSKE